MAFAAMTIAYCGDVGAAPGNVPVRIQAGKVTLLGHAKPIQFDPPATGGIHTFRVARMIPATSNTAPNNGAAVKIPVAPNLPVLNPSQNPNFKPLLAPALNSNITEGDYPYQPLHTSVEPPNPALCVGAGEVIETVDLEIEIFDTSGKLLSGPTNLFAFFGSPNITNKANGMDFIGLTRCYFDPPTNTFFFVATDLGNRKGGPAASALLLAVMPAGSTSPASIIMELTTDNGKATPIKHPHCPCYEDQPLIGADANGIYISGNEFAIATGAFNGGQIYAFNKADLIALNPDPGVMVFEAPNNLLDSKNDKDAAASIQPASATDGVYETANNGTEYFLSILDFAHHRDNRIAVWALTNTCAIPGTGACPSLTLSLTSAILASNAYGIPPNARQKKGLTPVGQFCGNNAVRLINTFDDRMQQVTFADGKLYAALTTVLTVNKKKHSGLLYFVVAPSVTGGAVGGSITDSNYVASDGLDLYYPAIAATQSGSAVMTFSFSGTNMFPSAGYIPLTPDLGMFEIHTAILGAGAYDGESGYPGCGFFSSALWGFTAAAVAESNTMWMATEYVSATCDHKTWAKDETCGGIRGPGSNWGTLLSNLVPPGGP